MSETKLSEIYYSPKGYWKGLAAVKKLDEVGKVSEKRHALSPSILILLLRNSLGKNFSLHRQIFHVNLSLAI